jgi:hypothetical protein
LLSSYFLFSSWLRATTTVCFFLNSKNGAGVQKEKRIFFIDEEITSKQMNLIRDISKYVINEFINLLFEKKWNFSSLNKIFEND